MRVEIEHIDKEYLLHIGDKEQAHPTLISLMRSVITIFHESISAEPQSIEKSVLVKTTKGLIDYLFQHKFSPSQVVDVLEHLESAINHNLGAVKNTGHTVQVQLIHEVEPEFTEAHPFPLKQLIPQWLGKSILYSYNGSLALQRRGYGGITVYLSKAHLDNLKHRSKKENHELLASAGIPEPKRTIIVEYIEDLKDDALGVFPKVRTVTRISGDAGEIDAEIFEQAGR